MFTGSCSTPATSYTLSIEVLQNFTAVKNAADGTDSVIINMLRSVQNAQVVSYRPAPVPPRFR